VNIIIIMVNIIIMVIMANIPIISYLSNDDLIGVNNEYFIDQIIIVINVDNLIVDNVIIDMIMNIMIN